MRLKNIAFLVLTLVFSQATAQDRSKLNFLVGNFVTEVTMPPGPSMPKGATGKGSSAIVWALDSTVLLIDEHSVNSLFGRYEGHGVLCFDAQTRQFELFMFNNFGDHPSYKGDFVGDTLMLETKVPMPAHPFDQRLLWYREGNVVKLKVMNNPGNGFVLAVDQTATPISAKQK